MSFAIILAAEAARYVRTLGLDRALAHLTEQAELAATRGDNAAALGWRAIARQVARLTPKP